MHFEVPKSTLFKYIKKGEAPMLGCKTILSKELESELVKYILETSRVFYGITPNDLRCLAYELAEKNGVKHLFDAARKITSKD
jgi:hypothetical protein